ncbi:LAME_0H03906g1_1 [Lachancea meyersii CBS 8951]|uniref:LAME_0H03906g1_1 n=1 Tax=Lachancea meyersii CBS 8951 TaxID=1266667 RepID=A0A1G4KDR4_9SACH|nr:LAME_0H03906g1_1 [Lachancea meyersii CBS 8951]
MYKLQVVLVPPSSINGALQLPFNPATTDNSQLLPSSIGANGSAILTGNRPEMPHSGSTNNNLFMSSFSSSHVSQPKLKKFLLFTQPTNSLLMLAEEIVAKCDKIYPHLAQSVELLSLQDSNECDLDPDFLVKDVFNVDNVVRAVLSQDIEVADDRAQTLYSVKRRKLDNGDAGKVSVANGASGAQPNVLQIAKKRPHILRNSTAMRVSTPLANQIYPQASRTQLNSDYEDDDAANRSILPPPQPQSQPIRISSAVDSAKKVNFSDNTISRSEAVDPDKSRQQRLPSGTPMRQPPKKGTTTPKRKKGQDQMLMVNEAEIDGSATPINTNKRITSGMLRIPEPKISEVEKELKQGPESPSAVLPARPDRIPMKKHDIPVSDDDELSQSSEDDERRIAVGNRAEQVLEPSLRLSASRQTSIADNNGSPIKDGSKNRNVNLAELPSSGRRVTRKSSLEHKVESLIRNSSPLAERNGKGTQEKKDDPMAAARKVSFSDEDEVEGQQLGQDPNDTVRINQVDNSGNSSFQKSELLSMLRGNKFDIPSDFSKRSLRSKAGYFEKSAEKSNALSKDVINQRLQRSAAIKAAELLSSGRSRNQEATSESEAESSDIETDQSDNGRVTVLENQALKKLNIHPLKEQVIGEGTRPILNGEADTSKAIAGAVPRKAVNGKNATQADTSSEVKAAATGPNGSVASKESKDKKAITKAGKTPDSRDADKVEASSSSTVERSSESESSTKSSTESSKEVSQEEISNKLIRGISPVAANREVKSYHSPEFIEDSDDDSMNTSSTKDAEGSKTKSATKKLPPSVLKRKEEAEKKRKERELLKKAREEENARKKAEKEERRREREEAAAKKKAEREMKKKKMQEDAIKKRELQSASKKAKDDKKVANSAQSARKTDKTSVSKRSDETADEATNSQVKSDKAKTSAVGESKGDSGEKEDSTSAALAPKDLSQYFGTGDKLKVSQNQEPLSTPTQGDKVSKIQKLKSQFTSGSLAPQHEDRGQGKSEKSSTSSDVSEELDDESSSNDNESSDSSSDDDSTASRKSRRGIVNTPKGAIISLPKKTKQSDISGLEQAPQSTQQALDNEPLSSGTKVPVTRMMEMSSPTSKAQMSSPVSNSKKPQSKPSRSLSSLSDLVSRGVPEVKDKTLKENNTSLRGTKQKEGLNNDLSQENSDKSGSEDDSDSSDDSSEDDSSSNFISAKSASKALGRQKKLSSGFASLVKDSKKNNCNLTSNYLYSTFNQHISIVTENSASL